jgi:hypothetical protein
MFSSNVCSFVIFQSRSANAEILLRVVDRKLTESVGLGFAEAYVIRPHQDRHFHSAHLHHPWKHQRLAYRHDQHDWFQLELGPGSSVLVLHAGRGPGPLGELPWGHCDGFNQRYQRHGDCLRKRHKSGFSRTLNLKGGTLINATSSPLSIGLYTTIAVTIRFEGAGVCFIQIAAELHKIAWLAAWSGLDIASSVSIVG